ncbi:uncharacterized protein LOC126718993 isoform X2 [Quercus robur]|uniref:uncharacterized protein LOC126718993 isoform X2 n=1 Tax=Quercus robur TaxID=38942 RepID=UPI0021636E7D|nr:uncharacterized protein LOC126718993 isoform X2 [Quercus robur]
MVALTASFAAAPSAATITMAMAKKRSGGTVCFAELSFPSFLPKQVENIKDTFARKLATRIDRLPVPVSFSDNSIMSSCVRPLIQSKTSPVVLLHGFDRLPPCNVAAKREHFYQLWKSHIKRPMILVGPSLGAAVAIDFVANHPEAVEKLVLIDASVYAEGTGNLATLPRIAAYAGVGRLHCLYPWWEDATVDFMISGGYNVSAQIQQVKQKTLIIWGEDDQIISNKLAVRLHCELPNATIRQIPDCGHLPHVERPNSVAKLIVDFVQEDCYKEIECVSQY